MSAPLSTSVQIQAVLGYAYLLDGQTAEAIDRLEPVIPQCIELGLVQPRSTYTSWLGEALLQDGQVQGALAQADNALALARTYGTVGPGAWAFRLRAESSR